MNALTPHMPAAAHRAAFGALLAVLTLAMFGPGLDLASAKPGKPQPVKGSVWIDADRDGVRDRGEKATDGVGARLQRATRQGKRRSFTTATNLISTNIIDAGLI